MRPLRLIERHLHVLGDRHGHERLGDLEGAAEAQAPDAARRQAGNVLVGEPDTAAVGRELAADHVEDGGLAGAVGADDRQQPPGVEAKRHVARGHHAAERLAQRLDAQKAHAAALSRGAAGPRPKRDLSSMAPPTMPRGKASTMAMMARPSSARQ